MKTRNRKKNTIKTSRNSLIKKFFILCFLFVCCAAFLCGCVEATQNTSLRYFGETIETVNEEDVENFFGSIKNMLFLS